MISDYTVNDKDTHTSIDGETVTGIRKELLQVRDKRLTDSMIAYDCLSGTQLHEWNWIRKHTENFQRYETINPSLSFLYNIFMNFLIHEYKDTLMYEYM